MSWKTENAILDIISKIQKYAGCSYSDACRIADPIIWWVSTGRCTGTHVRIINNLSSLQKTTIAKRMISCICGDYTVVIASVREYLDKLEGAV